MTVVINEFAQAVNAILARRDPVRRALTISPRAVRKNGKRARRAAFYHRARMCRLMTRIACAGLHAQEAELQERFRNVVVYGTSHPEVDSAPSKSSPFQRWELVDGAVMVTDIPMSEVYAAR